MDGFQKADPLFTVRFFAGTGAGQDHCQRGAQFMGGGGHEPGLSFLIFLKRFQDPPGKMPGKKRQQYDGSDIQQKKEETLSVDLRLQGIKGRQDDDLQGAAVSFGHSNAGAVAFCFVQ